MYLYRVVKESKYKRVGNWGLGSVLLAVKVSPQEAKYVESWPSTTSAWAGWSRFDIPVDRYGGVHSLLICTSCILGSSTCHQASQQDNIYRS